MFLRQFFPHTRHFYLVPIGKDFDSVIVIYINDMIEKVNNCKMHLYADDTVLYFSDANPLKVQRSLQEDLSRMYGWMCDNRLSLNCDKTVCML